MKNRGVCSKSAKSRRPVDRCGINYAV